MAELTPQKLIEKILASTAFSNSEEHRKLLSFLFVNQHRRISAAQVEAEHYGRPPNQSFHDPAHARNNIDALKDRLNNYLENAPSDERLKCTLPDAVGRRGYQLEFEKCFTTAETLFWEGHLNSEKPICVICDPLLFFYDHAQGSMTRFVDTNIDIPGRTQALAQLEKLHPKANPNGSLVPGHFYVNAGAVMAAERIRGYFWRAVKHHVPLAMNKEEMPGNS